MIENDPEGTFRGNDVTCDGIETGDGTGACRTTPGSALNGSTLNTGCQTFPCDATLGQCAAVDRPDRTFSDNGSGACLGGVCTRGGNDTTWSETSNPYVSGGCVAGSCIISGHGLACPTDWDCSPSGSCWSTSSGEPEAMWARSAPAGGAPARPSPG